MSDDNHTGYCEWPVLDPYSGMYQVSGPLNKYRTCGRGGFAETDRSMSLCWQHRALVIRTAADLIEADHAPSQESAWLFEALLKVDPALLSKVVNEHLAHQISTGDLAGIEGAVDALIAARMEQTWGAA